MVATDHGGESLNVLLAIALAITPASQPGPTPVQIEHYFQQLRGAPPVSYWLDIAQCETRSNWQNRGRWAGGLGIMTQGKREGTWERWGGEDFAPSPDRATMLEQIVVANRIAVFGWQTRDSFRTWEDKVANRPMFKYRVGFYGWGCAKDVVGNPCGKLKDGSRGTYRPPRRYRLLHC